MYPLKMPIIGMHRNVCGNMYLKHFPLHASDLVIYMGDCEIRPVFRRVDGLRELT